MKYELTQRYCGEKGRNDDGDHDVLRMVLKSIRSINSSILSVMHDGVNAGRLFSEVRSIGCQY